jgi:hypothetical protein
MGGFMDENWYVFTDEGKEACDAVLTALTGKFPGSKKTIADVRKHLTIDKEVISAILGNSGKPFRLKSLKSFFTTAIEEIESKHRKESKTTSKRFADASNHLQAYYTYCRCNEYENKKSWEIPDTWIKESGISKNTERRIVNALDLLNCIPQETTFGASFLHSCGFYNFSVVAPTSLVRNYLLKRLFSNLNQTWRGCSKLYLVNMSNLQCVKYSNFLDELIKIIGISGYQATTDQQKIAIICDCNFPTVLNIFNFQEDNKILEKFTKDLFDYFQANRSCSPQPRLIIFWNDRAPPCFNMPSEDFLVSLEPLNEISLSDINKWVTAHKEKHKILAKYESILLGLLLDWQDPQGVLDQICETLGVPNGITTIKNNWDLRS